MQALTAQQALQVHGAGPIQAALIRFYLYGLQSAGWLGPAVPQLND